MKVIFLTNVPFIRQHRIDMYVDAISEFFEISMWDLSLAYSNKDIVKEKEINSVVIHSLTEFSDKLSVEVSCGRVVIITGILIRNLKRIFPIINKLGVPIVNINKESFAAWMGDVGYMSQMWNGSIKSFIKALLVYNTFSRKVRNFLFYNGIKYDYLLSSYNFNPEESKQFVKIHHIKYDEYLTAKLQPSIIEGDYILFIDAALADHPMYTGHHNKIDRALYLSQINNYFNLLENKYKMKVVISAHPKSMYKSDDFMGREIIMYKTAVLIRYSKFVVSHYSTSLIDVVLYNKPLKVMYSSALMSSVCRYCTVMGLQMAKMLNVDTINLDSPKIDDFYVDINSYNNFRDKYIINNEKINKSNKELIIDLLLNLK